ncbi:MAG: DUF4212 domain-containing protein [Alphaproteobacteria bacterium]|jgi:putative solute:sodium symporter small subunit|nr:DUF4212 domain-containing protein [Alphaproteobacteria bacterium]
MTDQSQRTSGDGKFDSRGYWAAVIRLTFILLAIWFTVSYGFGILLRDQLDAVSLGGAPLGFWFAQQGAIYTFVALIFVYCFRMNALERKFGITEQNDG